MRLSARTNCLVSPVRNGTEFCWWDPAAWDGTFFSERHVFCSHLRSRENGADSIDDEETVAGRLRDRLGCNIY